MAKTKKEMRKMMGNYVDTILRYKKRNKDQEVRLQAWQEVNQINQALVGAVLLETVGVGAPVAITREEISKVIEKYEVLTIPTNDMTGFVMRLQKKEEAGE